MISLEVNGVGREFGGPPDRPILRYVRGVLGLSSTKFGCGVALCGACTVHIDGQVVRGCVTPVAAAAGKRLFSLPIPQQVATA